MKKLFALFFIVFASNSYSIQGACSSNWCEKIDIERLYPSAGSNLIYIATSGDEKNLACAAESDVYVTLDTSKTNGDIVYSTLLTAFASGKKVKILHFQEY